MSKTSQEKPKSFEILPMLVASRNYISRLASDNNNYVPGGLLMDVLELS